MSEIIYLNGEFVEKKDAKISVFDHGVLYGDGVFEGIRSYDRNVFRLDQHIERLFDSAKFLMLDIKKTQQEVSDIVVETLKQNNLDSGYVRLVVTRGEGNMGLNPYLCHDPFLFCIATNIKLYPEEYYQNGLPVIVSSVRRFDSGSFSPRVKSLNYLNNIMAKMEAIHAGVLEAIMLDNQGYIVECTGDNLFIVKDGVLMTPPTYQGALRGVTRDAVIDLARAEGIEVREQRMTTYEAITADEVFLTGTAAEVIPVNCIDKRTIADGKPGQMTHRLLDKFQEIVKMDGTKY